MNALRLLIALGSLAAVIDIFVTGYRGTRPRIWPAVLIAALAGVSYAEEPNGWRLFALCLWLGTSGLRIIAAAYWLDTQKWKQVAS